MNEINNCLLEPPSGKVALNVFARNEGTTQRELSRSCLLGSHQNYSAALPNLNIISFKFFQLIPEPGISSSF